MDTTLPREAALVVNTQSRRGEDQFHEARRKLTEAGVALAAVHAVDDAETFLPTVRRAVASGVPMVIVGGGDGSLSTAIDAFIGHDCVFALLPLGTANSFARTLGIPLDLDGAVRTIAEGRRLRLDLGVINGDYFVNAAALGVSPLIGETVPHDLKRYAGRLGYLLWAIWCLLQFKPFRLSVEVESRRTTLWATEVRIFNGRFHGGVEHIEDEAIDNGEIVVQAVTGNSLLPLAWNWFSNFLRLPGRNATTTEFRGSRLLLETRPRLKISIDGEVVARTPAIVESAHKAIEVAVPRPG